MATWYEVTSHSTKIRPVQVVGETEFFLKLPGGHRTAKQAWNCLHFKTEQEAREHLFTALSAKLLRLEGQVADIKAALDDLIKGGLGK